jgi:hypothetical protein
MGELSVDVSGVKSSPVAVVGISGINRESGAVEMRCRAGKQDVYFQRELDPDDISDSTTLGELAAMALAGVTFKANEQGKVEAIVPQPAE